MSKPTFVVTFLFLCSLHVSVHARPLALSDTDLEATTAGGDLCTYFGINGPCVASMLQIINPQAPLQSQEASAPLPANGSPATLTLQASSGSLDPSRTQTATQTNSSAVPQALSSLLSKPMDFSPVGIFSRTSPGFRP